ncbi:MAG TPA: MarR family transcriptional regulator [Candidatus Binataceae bacterium]
MQTRKLPSRDSASRKRALRDSLIRETRRYIADAILFNQQLADRLGINATDYQIINLVDLLGPATPGELAQMTGLSSGGVTVVLDRLEKAHYVERGRNPHDRRSVIVRMVAARRRGLNARYKSILARMDQVFAAYDEKQLGVINDFFMRSNRSRRLDAAPARGRPDRRAGDSVIPR